MRVRKEHGKAIPPTLSDRSSNHTTIAAVLLAKTTVNSVPVDAHSPFSSKAHSSRGPACANSPCCSLRCHPTPPGGDVFI